MLPVGEEDFRFIAENYLTQMRLVDYRKFLSDLKVFGGNPDLQTKSI